MIQHLLTNFEIQRHFLNEPKFNSRNNFPKIKDEAYIINLEELIGYLGM